MQQLLRSIALYPLTQRLHMSPDAFNSLVEQAQQEAADPTLKAYFPLYVLFQYETERHSLTEQICVHWQKAIEAWIWANRQV